MGYLWSRNISFISIKFLQKQFISNYCIFNSRVRIIIHYKYLYSQKSYDDIDLWLKDLKANASPDIKIFLIGNKVDLDDQRVIMKESAETFKEEYDLDLFMETSAKTGMNAQELFVEAAKILFNDYNRYKSDRKKSDGEVLKKNNTSQPKKKGCC